MMLGIAASISIAVPSGRRSHGGDSSVRNSAMPKLTGIPMSRAMREVTSVPTMGTSAPNFSVTGFQSELVRNPRPKAFSAGMLPTTSETMAVTFVIGNAHQLSASLFMPGNSIASALANEFTEAVGGLYTSSLIELGLILFLITTIVLALSKVLLMQLAKREGATT